MAEWFKALVLKTSVGETPPRVRIPELPPLILERIIMSVLKLFGFFNGKDYEDILMSDPEITNLNLAIKLLTSIGIKL